MALSVASLINGPILGVFLVGAFLKRATEIHALIGMLTSIFVMTFVLFGTSVAWPWYALIGSLLTFTITFIATLVIPGSKNDEVPV